MRSCLLCGAMVAVLMSAMGCGPESETPLFCYCGGTMRPAMTEVAKLYTEKTGQQIDFKFGDSGELIIGIDQTREGDLCIVHDPFLASMMKKGLAERGWVVAVVTPVIVVPKGNPKGIHGFRDLTKEGLKVVVTDAEYSTGGYIVDTMARKAGLTKELNANIVNRPRSGNDAANAVLLGTADAAICWNAIAHERTDKLDVIQIEPECRLTDADAVTTATFGRVDMDYVRVTLAVLKFSKQPEAAKKFAEFAASDEAAKVWQKLGFSPVDKARDAAK